jgi:phosphoadenosine phosphosulfate reductase
MNATMSVNQQEWTTERLQALNKHFEHASPREILQWAYETFGDGAVMGTGFGPSGVVLTHQVSSLHPDAVIFYLDTDLLFPETYALRDELAEQLGITFTRVHSEVSLVEQETVLGEDLWKKNPNACCFIRKVLPLRRFLSDKSAWITGLRRDQSRSRAGTKIVEWDAANNVVKINPLAQWTSDDIWGYIHLNEVPYNQLHNSGYPSIGCMPCTKPVATGMDERAGRWAGFNKTECGIHLQPHAA